MKCIRSDDLPTRSRLVDPVGLLMTLLDRLARVPGGLMLIPLLLGAALNTVDELHLAPLEALLRFLDAPVFADPVTGQAHRSLLRLGGFATALTASGAPTLIAFFLVCVAAQMDFSVGRAALRKGVVITTSKWLGGVAVAYAWSALGDGFTGPLGLSTVAIMAAMTNGNGGLYLALTSRFGSKSDMGAISVISLNDGPFLTLVGLGVLGASFPAASFLSVLLPMLVGFALGQWEPRVRRFLAAGERLVIPFFAFALGTSLTFTVFTNVTALAGGVLLGAATVLITGSLAAAALRLTREPHPIAAWAEASTAGNAVQTPAAVALAAASMAAGDKAEQLSMAAPMATAQISVAVMVSALLCPLVVAAMHRRYAGRALG